MERAGLIDSTKLRSKSLKDSITVVYWAGRWRRLRALLKPRWLRSMTKAFLKTSCTKGCGFHALERFHQIPEEEQKMITMKGSGFPDDQVQQRCGVLVAPPTLRWLHHSRSDLLCAQILGSDQWKIPKDVKVICAKQHWLAFNKN